MAKSDHPGRPDLSFEETHWDQGALQVAGIDEAGRGALAGPVFAAAVVLPPQKNLVDHLAGVNDSKQLTALQRTAWAERIREVAFGCSLGTASAQEIDALGVLNATRLAAHRALLGLASLPDHLLIDYIRLPQVPIPQTSLVRGDARSLSIASASILAKTARDAEMHELDRQHPGYHWARNKGYGTRAHMEAIRALGPCKAHRFSFAPLRGTIDKNAELPGMESAPASAQQEN